MAEYDQMRPEWLEAMAKTGFARSNEVRHMANEIIALRARISTSGASMEFGGCRVYGEVDFDSSAYVVVEFPDGTRKTVTVKSGDPNVFSKPSVTPGPAPAPPNNLHNLPRNFNQAPSRSGPQIRPKNIQPMYIAFDRAEDGSDRTTLCTLEWEDGNVTIKHLRDL